MKLYYTTIKALVILFSIFSVNLLYGGDDEFSVTVTEKVSGPIKEVEICYNSILDLNGFTVPSFSVSSGVAEPEFTVTFNFADQIPPDGRLFIIYGYVYVKNNANSYTPVSLNNSVLGGNYVMGNSGTSQGGEVTLNVRPIFNVLSNCSYYFGFALVDITHQNGGPLGSSSNNTENDGSEPGTPTVASSFSFASPRIMLTKEGRDCTQFTRTLCKTAVGGNPTNTNRTSLGSSNSKLDILPNPTSTGKVVLDLEFEEQRSHSINIEVLNIQGKLLKHEQVPVTAAQTSLQQKLDMRALPAGIYLIKVDTGSQKLIQKLIIQ